MLTISCSKGLRTSGDVVSGVLNLNLALAEQKNVVSVTISMRGEINTHATILDSNNDITTLKDRVQLFTEQQVIWSPGDPVPPHASGIANFPFAFTIPTTDLPPSFYAGGGIDGGSVQYYLHAEAERKSWYQVNVRVDAVFTFLPVDQNPAPSLPLPPWPHGWQVFRADKKVRRTIMSHHGLVKIEFHMPSLTAIPLFLPIPLRLRVICSSKLLPTSAENDLETFVFPRNPAATDVDLTLRQVCAITVQGHHRKCIDELGLQAGFGIPDEKKARTNWGDQIQTSATPPRWVVDEADKGKGRWSEEITFLSTLIFRCSPPLSFPKMTSSLYLDLDVDFSGVMNNVKIEMGPLSLAPGIPPRRDQLQPPEPHTYELDIPPSYYEVMRMDEKKGA